MYSRRGTKNENDPERRAERLVKEMDAAWYFKHGEYIWGYAANFAVSTANTAGQRADFPITIRAFNLSVPNTDVTGEAVKLGEQLVDAGHGPDGFAHDRGYAAGKGENAMHRQLTRLGYRRVFD